MPCYPLRRITTQLFIPRYAEAGNTVRGTVEAGAICCAVVWVYA
jgi:hypothetical protein